MTNSENILKALEHYQQQLSRLREELIKKEAGKIHDFFAASRDYRNSIPEASAGPLKKTYAFYAIIGGRGPAASLPWQLFGFRRHQHQEHRYIHNREFEEAVLRVELYDEDAY